MFQVHHYTVNILLLTKPINTIIITIRFYFINYKIYEVIK